MKPVVLAFSGSIASGKSTLSRAVAETLDWPYVSFGDFVRTVAQSRGLGDSREALQEVGVSLIREGWTQFCRSVLNQITWRPGQPLVVDGIRHIEAVSELQKLVAPSEFLLVFVETSNPIREARLRTRKVADGEKLQHIESHSTEAQVKVFLAGMANLAVDGTQPIEELVQNVIFWLQKPRCVQK